MSREDVAKEMDVYLDSGVLAPEAALPVAVFYVPHKRKVLEANEWPL